MKSLVFVSIILYSSFSFSQDGGSFIDERDGHEYRWVDIGEQTWMAENLAYLPNVSPPTSESYTEPFYYVLDYHGSSVIGAKEASNYHAYGALYNWPAAMAGSSTSSSNPSDVQGVCPAGWHLPSLEEWEELAQFISDDNGGYTKTDEVWYNVGGHLKATTTWLNGGNGTDDYGFEGLAGGNREWNSQFVNEGIVGVWHSTTEEGSDFANGRFLRTESSFSRDYLYHKERGMSVRCIKNEEDLISISFESFENSPGNKSTKSIPNINYTLAYHDNSQDENHLRTLSKTSDDNGFVEFFIPQNSNFTIFVDANEYDPHILTELGVVESEEYNIYLNEISDKVYIETPGIIAQIYENGESCMAGYCSQFEQSPPIDATVNDYRDFLYSHYSSNEYGYSIIQLYTIEDSEVRPAVIAKPTKKEDYGTDICNTVSLLAGVVASKYIGGFVQVGFPFCGSSREPGMYIDGVNVAAPGAILYHMQPPPGAYIDGNGWSVKKNTATLDQKYTDPEGNITGSIYADGIFIEDKYDAPGVYYSGHGSQPSMLFFDQSLEGELVFYHNGNTEVNGAIIRWVDSTNITKPLTFEITNEDSILVNYSIDTITEVPIAHIQIESDSVLESQKVDISGSGSLDPFGQGLDFAWIENGEIFNNSISISEYFLTGEHNVVLEVKDTRGIISTDNVRFIVVDGHTSAKNNSLSDSGLGINLFPNPTTDALTVTTDIAGHYLIEVSTLSGHMIFSQEMKRKTQQFDFSSFQKGVYLITLRSKGFVTTRKIIKL